MFDHHTRSEERAHDVLAAEEFAVPTPDPALEPAHDVLAADEFAVPTRDPSLHHSPVVLPGDPSGIQEPHDVLAAEEFALPATLSSSKAVSLARQTGSMWRIVAAVGAGVMLARLIGRRRRRRHGRG
jgi:hypothetical protein